MAARHIIVDLAGGAGITEIHDSIGSDKRLYVYAAALWSPGTTATFYSTTGPAAGTAISGGLVHDDTTTVVPLPPNPEGWFIGLPGQGIGIDPGAGNLDGQVILREL